MRKLFSAGLTVLLVILLSLQSAFAENEENEDEDTGVGMSSQVTLTVHVPTMSVTLPTSLPYYKSTSFEVYTATGIEITNNCQQDIAVKSIEIMSANAYKYTIRDKDIKTNVYHPVTDTVIINGKSALPVNYAVKAVNEVNTSNFFNSKIEIVIGI